LCRSSGLLKISRDGFETVEISENCAGSVNIDAGFVISAVFAVGILFIISVGSGDAIRLGVSNAGSIEGVEIAFEFSKNN